MNVDDERELFEKLNLINRRLAKIFMYAVIAVSLWVINGLEKSMGERWNIGDPWVWIISMVIVLPLSYGVYRDFER